MGIHGIIVSNHGGRQIDGAIGSLDALSKIMRSTKVLDAQKKGDLTVLFDSGIRTGSDVVKAMAMGAQAVLSACPNFYRYMIFLFELQLLVRSCTVFPLRGRKESSRF